MRFYELDCDKKTKEILDETKEMISVCRQGEGIGLISHMSEEKGYSLKRENEKVILTYHKTPDLCRALLYLASTEEEELQQEVNEVCAFEEIGIMADVSRNAVLRMETIKQLIRYAAFMGYTFVGLYMEDTIVLKDEPYFGYMRGAFKQEEIKEADTYAQKYGIELRPFIQTLAHLNQITRYEEYQEIIDTEDILLVGEERTKELLDHLLGTIAQNFSTKKINIGMDEAHMVGLGKYLDRHGFEDRFGILERHLKTVLSLCQKYGFKAQMWSDMYFRLAFHGDYYVKQDEGLPAVTIPEEIELAYWDYYSLDEAHYDEMLKQHLLLTSQIAFAGGAWKWTGFTPHNAYSISIGKAAIAACRKNRISSVTITCWGDDGAEADVFSVLPALFADAQEAYQSNMPKRAFKNLCGCEMKDMLLLDCVNPYSVAESHNNAGKYLLYNDLLIGTFDSVVKEDLSTYYKELVIRLEQVKEKGALSYLFETQIQLCRVLEKKAEMGKNIRNAYKNGKKETLEKIELEELPELLHRLEKFYDVFRTQWYQNNKAMGFEVQTVRLGGLMQRVKEVKNELHAYLAGECDEIEALEEKQLPFAYFKEQEIKTLNYNRWSDIVSPSKL